MYIYIYEPEYSIRLYKIIEVKTVFSSSSNFFYLTVVSISSWLDYNRDFSLKNNLSLICSIVFRISKFSIRAVPYSTHSN